MSLSLTGQCNNYYSPSLFRVTATISSRAKTSMSVELDARVGTSIHQTEAVRLKPGETRQVPLDVELPQLEIDSTHSLVAAVRRDGTSLAVTSSTLWLAPSSVAFFEQPPTTWPIALLGDAKRQKGVLDAMACRSMVGGRPKESSDRFAVFAAGRTTDTLERQISALRQNHFFRRGGVLVVFDTGDGKIALPGIKPVAVDSASRLEPVPWGSFWDAFPAMSGLLNKWGTGLIDDATTAPISKRFAWKITDKRRAEPIVIGSGNEGVYVLWVPVEKGGVLLNGLPLLDYSRLHPAAGLMIRQMLSWAGEKVGREKWDQ